MEGKMKSSTSSSMEPDDHAILIPGLKNIDSSSSSSSVIDSISESDKGLVSSFQSFNLSENQQDHKNVIKDERFDHKEPCHPYPLKHGVENCPYYMRTGTCSFGMNCRYNHPIWRAPKVHGGKQEKQESLDQTKHIDCKFDLASEECKDDSARISWHCKERIEIEPVELNFLGLPIRPRERDCAFYMRNVACPDGIDCRFNHPEPTFNEGSSERAAVDTSTEGKLNNEEDIPKQDSDILHHMGTSSQYPAPHSFDVMLSKNFSNPRSQSSKPMFLERPGQPFCDHFMKTGFCKYKSSCRYHHPKKRASTVSSRASRKRAGGGNSQVP